MMPKHLLATQLHVATMYALGNIGEEPKGSNRGFWVEEFQEDAGINPGDAWCMAGVYSCHRIACYMQRIKKPYLKRTGWCKGQFDFAANEPRLSIITAEQMIEGGQEAPDGSVWIRFDLSGKGHTGFVYDHDPRTNTLKSIEFNHSDKVDREEYIITNIENFKGVIV